MSVKLNIAIIRFYGYRIPSEKCDNRAGRNFAKLFLAIFLGWPRH
jgi:hypothetical protein